MKRTALLIVGFVLLFGAFASAQKKQPQLKWYGHSYFVLETSTGTKVAFDPHGISAYGSPMVEADVILISHQHNDHNQRGVLVNGDKTKFFEGVAIKGKKVEWQTIDEKVKGVRIRTVTEGVYHDDEDGKKRGKNSIFVVEADGLTFVHLGDLGHELTDDQIKEIGSVDVLMIPVGGIYTINGGTAKKVVAQLKPRLFVLPMHCATKVYEELLGVDEFLDGQKNVRKLTDANVLEIPLDTKPAAPSVVILGWQ